MTSHSQSFLHTRILPNMLSLIPWGMLNGTGCPKNQPAILDQTIFKLRILKLKTFSRKVHCSKDIIFMVITSTQTSVSVLHSHKFVKHVSFSVSPKENHHPEIKCSLYNQPLSTRATTGSHVDKEPHPSSKFSCNGLYSNMIKYLN